MGVDNVSGDARHENPDPARIGWRRSQTRRAGAGKRLCPDAEIKVCDILDFTAPIFKQTYAERYLDVVKKVPELWGYMYSRSDKKALDPLRRRLRSFVNKANTIEFTLFYREFAPDIVVCTHFMPLEIISTKLSKGKTDASLFCTVTDFAVHSLWIMEHVDCYYVATEEAKRQIVRHGQAADRVAVKGIPIDPVFAQGLPADVARKQLAMDDGRPVVLILSGGFGVGPAVELIRAIGASEMHCRLLVVAGANQELKASAEAAARGFPMPVTVFGFVNNMHELMDAADLIVSKPGGLTSSEVLAKGKPMLIIDPIPGQEQRNCEYLLEAGAAARLFDIEDAGYKIKGLLSDKGRLARMGRSASKVAHPTAALDIARDILARHQDRITAQGGRAPLRDAARS